MKEPYNIRKQQVFPGQRPGQGPPSAPPGFPPGQTRPGTQPQSPSGQVGRGMQPPSPPPNFTPEMPQAEAQPFAGRAEARSPGGGIGIIFPGFRRDLRGCINRFTYIWLINGNNFWFYPIFTGRQTVEGFRWRRNAWVYDRINTNRILFFRCF